MSDYILFAPNVHSGGGLVLLQAILGTWNNTHPLTAFLDARGSSKLELPDCVDAHWVSPNPISRTLAQLQLYKKSRRTSTIVCFNGLPPLFPVHGTVTSFIQNRLFFENPAALRFPLRTKLRLHLEQLLLQTFQYRINQYIVQTESMYRKLLASLNITDAQQVQIVPFLNAWDGAIQTHSDEIQKQWDFIYVADGQSHKNHERLLDAWCLLAKEGIKPSLLLTIGERDRKLVNRIRVDTENFKTNTVNLGVISHDQIQSYYRISHALIYPSLVESFGLPLLEAQEAGIPILAGELDYVRDVCTPVETFDPTSSVSISRAVRRFLKVRENANRPVGPAHFWDRALNRIAPASISVNQENM